MKGTFDDGIYSEVLCNGKFTKVLIDTGAAISVIGNEMGKELNVRFFEKDTILLNGLVAAVCGVIDSIEIGTLKIKNYPVAVVVDSEIIKEKGNVKDADREKMLEAYNKYCLL
ncbi:MAG: retropepsin-like domain-containing protein [Tannerellaceae bacterium]|nr:retropepsin-like domain-containing protein [Tannerellaceae bacterium]